MRTIVIILSACFLAASTLWAETVRTKNGISYYDAQTVAEGPTWVKIKTGGTVLRLSKSDILPPQSFLPWGMKKNEALVIGGLVALLGGLIAFCSRMHRTLRWLGRVTVRSRVLTDQPEGNQVEFTPAYQDILIVSAVLLALLVFAVGCSFGWYVGALFVLSSLAASHVVGLALPRSVGHYLGLIEASMRRRELDFRRRGLLEHADLTQSIRQSMDLWTMAAIGGPAIAVPSWKEARTADGDDILREVARQTGIAQLLPVAKPQSPVRQVVDKEKPLLVTLIEEAPVPAQIRSPEKTASEIRGLEEAALRGAAEAQYQLGLSYRDGNGKAKDPHEAKKLFQQAAKQGHAGAERCLHFMKAEG